MKNFKITSALAHATSGQNYNGENVAVAHHDAGFEVIPLGGIKLVTQVFEDPHTADAYVATCVVPVEGEQILRETLEDGRIRVQACVPLFPEAGDRCKVPLLRRWGEAVFQPEWWQDGVVVPLPPGWTDWGSSKKGKPITQRRGDRRHNVGVRTGPSAGLVVIDIDQRDDLDGLASLEQKFGEQFATLFPETYSVRSPTGGLHFYYASTAPISNSAGALAPGVDVRGEGGQVVAAGSVRMNGRRYTIVNEVDVAPLPEETERLLLALRPERMERAKRKQSATSTLMRAPTTTREQVLKKCLGLYPRVEAGTRHHTLMSVAGHARNLLSSDDDLEWAIRQFAEQRGVAQREPEDLDRIVADAKNLTRTPPPPPRARIVVDTNQARVVRELEDALSGAPGLFRRGGALVRVLRSAGSVLPPVVQAVPREALGPWSTDFVEWAKEKVEDGIVVEVPCFPPGWAVAALHAGGDWASIPELVGVVEHPVFLPDGRVLFEVGYDRESGLLLLPSAAVDTVPENTTQDDARRAVDAIKEMVCDFPFADPISASAALAAILTPAARHAIAGCVPLMVIDKSTRGVGGSLFSDVISTLYTGRPMARMTQASSDEEQRKVITSLLIDASPLVLLDNIITPLGGYALDALLTAQTWKDRLLGTNVTVTLPVRCTFYATGNNIVFKGDTSRRALKIRMVSPLENPEERDGFRHPQLLRWVAEERPRLLAAVLTVFRGYHVAGRPFPSSGASSWGSFDAWSQLVRGALIWLGEKDPGLARGALDDAADSDKSVLAELVYGWAELALQPRPALTARDALDVITADGTGKRYLLLRGLFTLPNGNLMSSKDVVAKFLRKYKDRTIDGMCVTDAGTARTKTTLWVVRIVDRPTFDAAVSRLTVDKQRNDANGSDPRGLPE